MLTWALVFLALAVWIALRQRCAEIAILVVIGGYLTALTQNRAELVHAMGRCLRCGYAKGERLPKCPECGWFDLQAPGESLR